MTSTVDLGTVFAESLLADVVTSTANYPLPPYGLASFIAGADVPIMDCCAGLLWTRVDTVYPTDGSGQPFTQARWDPSNIPAWAFPIQVGFLWCHENIDDEGNMVSPAVEQANAQRDAAYRAAIYLAIVELFPESLRPCGASYRMTNWTPFGPAGSCSGGGLTVTVISPSLVTMV